MTDAPQTIEKWAVRIERPLKERIAELERQLAAANSMLQVRSIEVKNEEEATDLPCEQLAAAQRRADVAADTQWVQGTRFAVNCYESGNPRLIDEQILKRSKEIVAARIAEEGAA